jgi:hypothetical protein
MKIRTIINSIIILTAMEACQDQQQQSNQESKPAAEKKSFSEGSFGYDLQFLQARDSVIVLRNSTGEGQVLVSAKYQGKVFTSTAAGLEGKSFGWLNYKAFDAPKDPHMNAYGGENRLWLGPEGGKYSIYFKPGAKMEFANWVTPPSIDTEAWTILRKDSSSVSMQKDASLLNYAGTTLQTRIRRDVQILENSAIEQALGMQLDPKVKAVGFRTQNALTNAGTNAWTKESGAPCIWILDMFNVSAATNIVIPYNVNAQGKIATTDYFGAIPEDRIQYKDGVLLFKADGKMRGKLGLAPGRAKPVAGSYDAENNVLTITSFDVDPKATYLNQEWTTDKDPLKGDAVNAYNDGPLEDGSQMGPFYEIESVSPAAFLKSGETLNHRHDVYHFTGDRNALNAIAQKILGISLDEIQNTFRK